jgi:molybdopterin-guanine dinucleotide biosynthesis protein A
MLTGIILAGGKSTRMGKDKAFLRGGVIRLAEELRNAGCSRIIVMCGTKERSDLFSEECIEDTGETLAESLKIVLDSLEGEIQLSPCDAVLADAEFFSSLTGVPLDQNGSRQPLLARFHLPLPHINSDRMTEMFAHIPSCPGGIKATNVNTPEEFKEI